MGQSDALAVGVHMSRSGIGTTTERQPKGHVCVLVCHLACRSGQILGENVVRACMGVFTCGDAMFEQATTQAGLRTYELVWADLEAGPPACRRRRPIERRRSGNAPVPTIWRLKGSPAAAATGRGGRGAVSGAEPALRGAAFASFAAFTLGAVDSGASVRARPTDPSGLVCAANDAERPGVCQRSVFTG